MSRARIQKRITTLFSGQPDQLEVVVERRHPEDAPAVSGTTPPAG